MTSSDVSYNLNHCKEFFIKESYVLTEPILSGSIYDGYVDMAIVLQF